MILEQQKQSLVLQEGEQTQESIGMSLDLDSAQILMQMLSKNLYSDAVGSTIRECASNALDSHRRAGTTDPIIVSFKRNKDNNFEFSVEDFGIGLDADDVKNIISKYGKSTKRNSSTELGMMGLGFKAPLAYSSSFYFVARKNGVERKYMMYEGEDVNTIDLLYETATTERNGVKVIVPVNYYDRVTFSTKIEEQLAYFEGVYFDVPDNNSLDNDHKIYKHSLFQWSTLEKDGYMHICLDNVYYPLDFKKLGINDIRMSLGLRFSLTDGIFPTPNRESIRYTSEAKETILKRIKDVATHLVTCYNETVIGTDDPLVILDHYNQSSKYVVLTEGIKVDVRDVEIHSDVTIKSPVLTGYKYITAKFININRQTIQNEYSIMNQISYGRAHTLNNGWRSSMSNLNKNSIVYVIQDRFSGNVKDYLREQSKKKNETYYVVKHTRKMPLKSKSGGDNYCSLLSLHNLPKSEWRAAIQEYQRVVAKLNERFIPIENVVIPKEWLDARKRAKVKVNTNTKRRKIEGEVVGKVLEKLERWVSGKESKLVSKNIPMENAHRNKVVTVYGNQSDYPEMDKLFAAIPSSWVRLIVFSDRELKLLQDLDLHNWIKMEDFMKGEHKLFRRVVTAKLIQDLTTQYRAVFRSGSFFTNISTEIDRDILELNNYVSRNHTHASQGCYDAMLEVAKAHNYYDTTIIDLYHKMKAFLERFSFLETLVGTYNHRNKKIEQIAIDLLKYHGKRLNWQVYKINEGVNETPVSEEVLEDII